MFDGYYDIPFIPKQHFDLVIDKLIAYDKTYKHIYEPGEVAHFYLDDQKFDGPKGIWNGLSNNENYKRGFDLTRFDGATAIITPDCIFRIIPARYLGNCRPHQKGEANYAEGYLKADRQDIL